MKIFLILLFSILLPACSVYTLTNNTNQDVRFQRAGGENEEILKPGKCVVLSEYLVGLSGDFPFTVVEGQDAEYKPGSYEITESANTDPSGPGSNLKVSLSDKNPSCEEEKKDDQDTQDTVNMVPVCEGEEEVKCNSPETKAQCIKKDEKVTPACMDKENKPKAGVTPVCGDTDKAPVCKEKETGDSSSVYVEDKIKPLCLYGEPVCQGDYEVSCTREKGQFIPACLKENKKINNDNPYCPDDSGSKPICINYVQITAHSDFSVFCGSGQTAYCSGSGLKMVCGTRQTSQNIEPYCVRSGDNVLWNVTVLCSNNTTPQCQRTQ